MEEKIKLLFENINWNKPHQTQEKARKELQKLKDLRIFIQPTTENTGKRVWENCARILLKKSDDELLPYLNELFEWLQDRNWPGEYIIRYRIQKFEYSQVKQIYNECLGKAKKTDDEIWYENLQDLHFRK